MEEYTSFGYQSVKKQDKEQLVKSVFSSVAENYDLMNDLMSGGIHRLWKKRLLDIACPLHDDIAVDVASGTADVALGLAKATPKGKVWLTDINKDMLEIGRDKILNNGIVNNTTFAIANAEQLPFPENYCNIITIAFGLRNVTDKQKALDEMHRVLKPGGKALILEFSKPTSITFNKIYDLYSFKILPKIGKYVAKDEPSYQYLVESIRKHPDQETLKSMMVNSGFALCDYENLTGGITAIHYGIK